MGAAPLPPVSVEQGMAPLPGVAGNGAVGVQAGAAGGRWLSRRWCGCLGASPGMNGCAKCAIVGLWRTSTTFCWTALRMPPFDRGIAYLIQCRLLLTWSSITPIRQLLRLPSQTWSITAQLFWHSLLCASVVWVGGWVVLLGLGSVPPLWQSGAAQQLAGPLHHDAVRPAWL